MISESKVFVAGVGFSSAPPRGSPANAFVVALVSAATKALLDAGVTCDDVARGVTSIIDNGINHGSEALKVFDEEDVAVDEVERGSEFLTSIRWVRDRGARCVLMIAIEEYAALAFVLVSDPFLWSHPYLRDSAAFVRELDAPRSKSEGPPREGLHDVCQMVWALRGWSHTQGMAAMAGLLFYQDKWGHRIELRRADTNPIPKWEEVEYKQDGKHRLGYNAAVETREISQEDLEAVRASGKRRGKLGNWIRFVRKGGDKAALSKL